MQSTRGHDYNTETYDDDDDDDDDDNMGRDMTMMTT
jgi:hypothetical protein